MAIKKLPQDFIVDEVLTSAWQQQIARTPAAFAIYVLQKTSVTTPQAVAELAKQLGVKPGAVAYAGLKDKHGVTTQHITIESPARGAPLPNDVAASNWSARRLGYVDSKIDAGAIEANRFRLVIRTLTRRDIDDMNAQVERLATDEQHTQLLVPNYFGNQRFGSLRAGEGFIARHLIDGQFEQALRLAIGIPDRKDDKRTKAFKRAVSENWGSWKRVLAEPMRLPERAAIEHLAEQPSDFRGAFAKLPYFLQQIWVDAYQSWLWNETASELLSTACDTSADDVLCVNDVHNRLIFPHASAVDDRLAQMLLPVLGHESKLQPPWDAAAARVLKREAITTSALSIPGLRRPQFSEYDRPLFIRANDFHAGNPQPDELQTKAKRFKRNISFTLPRGAYATVVLRGLSQ